MRVTLGAFEYTLYIGANGIWTMHTWQMSLPHGQQYVTTDYNVSAVNPFLSEVTYDAWR
jgi:hypothetical protein